MAKKTGIAYKRHHEIGALLKQINIDLVFLQVELSHAYPITGKKGLAFQSLERTRKHLLKMRGQLEENYAAEHPDTWDIETYYGE